MHELPLWGGGLKLWGGGLIVATALALLTSYVVQAWDNLNRDLLQNAEDIGSTTAHALFPVMLHDEVWAAFEMASLPFTANSGTPLIASQIVLDKARNVYVTSHPQEYALLSPLASLGPDIAAFDREPLNGANSGLHSFSLQATVKSRWPCACSKRGRAITSTNRSISMPFTGAARTKKGVFELAHGGTLFLDEIGDMPLSMQVKLLRALQERCIVRVGAELPIPVDLRLVCATHQMLRERVSNGSFREDLYYRINVVESDGHLISHDILFDRPAPALAAW